MDLEKHYTQAFGGMRDVYPMRRDDSMSMKFKRQGSGRGYDNFMKFISNPVGTIKETISMGKDMLGKLGFGDEGIEDRPIMNGGEEMAGGRKKAYNKMLARQRARAEAIARQINSAQSNFNASQSEDSSSSDDVDVPPPAPHFEWDPAEYDFLPDFAGYDSGVGGNGLIGGPNGMRKLIGGPAGMRKLIGGPNGVRHLVVENIQPAHMTGGKIAVKDLKRFIDSSYERKDKDGKIKQKEQNISGYILDPELTRDESSVYYNPTTNHVIHNIRGTNGTAKDWSNNAVYAASPYLYQKLDRFKRSKKNQEAVERKYANAKKSITTHSQSGIIGRYLAKDRPDTEIIQLNPASSYKDNDVSKNDKNVYTVKSTKDVVSLFHKNQPQDIIIPGESLDQFKEHDIGLLDRLEPDKQIGFGRNRYLTPIF